MSAVEQSERWPIDHFSVEEIADAEVVHAKWHYSDDFTLCEEGGAKPMLPSGTVARNLDVPASSEQSERPVDCPACLEWMHA